MNALRESLSTILVAFETPKDRQRKPWTQLLAILIGIGLMVLSLGTFMLLREPVSSVFPRADDGGVGDLFNELARSPMLFALIMGPGLIIGAGVFEELTRVFLLTRLWKAIEASRPESTSVNIRQPFHKSFVSPIIGP